MPLCKQNFICTWDWVILGLLAVYFAISGRRTGGFFNRLFGALGFYYGAIVVGAILYFLFLAIIWTYITF